MSPDPRTAALAPLPTSGLPASVAADCGIPEDEWTRTLLDLLPRGPVWPRDPDTVLYRFWAAVAVEAMRIQARDCDLLAEAYPCGAAELLADWERVLGLPDECTLGGDWTLTQRRNFVCAKLAAPGGQSRAFYVALAASYGYTITIVEHWPWRIGCAPLCDGTRIGVPLAWWVVVSPGLPVSHATVGCWFMGQPICVVQGAGVLECIIRRAAPAQSLVTFAYQLFPAVWNKGRWKLDAWSA